MSDFIDDYLNKADPSDLRNVVRAQAINVNELQRRTLNVTTLDQITPRVGTRLDTVGHVGLIRLNRLLLFNTQATPSIILPPDALTGSNILEVVLTGQLLNNTGGNQTVTPRFYLGKSGSETLVSSDTSITIPYGVAFRSFEYRLRVSAASSGGVKVQTDEKFLVETTSGTGIAMIMRTTKTTVTDIITLSDVDSCFMRIANGAPATMFKIITNTLSVQVLDAVGADEIHWYSQPGAADGKDTYIIKESPTANFGSAALVAIGEMNAGSFTERTLIRFDELDNFQTDPDLKGFQVLAAYLYLTVATNYANNARTADLFRLLVDFDPAVATWNIRKTSTNWNTPGGGSGTDYASTPLASTAFSAESVGVTKSFSLNPTEMQKIIDGIYPNYGYLIQMRTEVDDGYGIHSAEATSIGVGPTLYLIGTKPN